MPFDNFVVTEVIGDDENSYSKLFPDTQDHQDEVIGDDENSNLSCFRMSMTIWVRSSLADTQE